MRKSPSSNPRSSLSLFCRVSIFLLQLLQSEPNHLVGVVVLLLRLRELETFPLVVPAVALLPPALDDADSEVPEVPGDKQP